MENLKLIGIPNNLILEEYFEIPKETIVKFLSNVVGYVTFDYKIKMIAANPELTARMHTGDHRIWFMDGGYWTIDDLKYFIAIQTDTTKYWFTILDAICDLDNETYNKYIEKCHNQTRSGKK